MKIMFNVSSMGRGGAERVIANLANNLIKGHEITILANIKENLAYKLDSRIKIIPLDKKRRNIFIRTINRTIKTVKIIKKDNPDIIISFLPVPSYRVLLLKSFFKKPIIVCDRNDPNQEYASIINKILMKISYPKADGFVFQTKEQKEYFDKKIQDRSVIIHNPIKEEFLQIEERKRENVIINVGRLVEQKNQRMLIKVFSEIVENHKEYTLKIFGEGPLKNSLQNQINELNLQDEVKLCGTSNNIKEELEKSQIFVLTSNYEGMPNALIEAMVVGLPCISTNCHCGGPKELIENKKNGLLIPVGNEKILKDKLECLIKNKDYREELGNKAKDIGEKLEITKIVEKWEEFIEYIYKRYINEN